MDWKKNDVFQTIIEDMSDSGEGIGKTDGFTWFIKDAVIGDRVEAKAMKVKKSYGFARLLQVLEPSDKRTAPLCPVARQCGGCQIQAMDYQEQLRFKENKVCSNLRRIGGLEHLMRKAACGMKRMELPMHCGRKKALNPVRSLFIRLWEWRIPGVTAIRHSFPLEEAGTAGLLPDFMPVGPILL